MKINAVSYPAGVIHVTTGGNSLSFGVTSYDNPTGNGVFKLYINTYLTDCGVNGAFKDMCVWDNAGLHNGFHLTNYNGNELTVKLELSDGLTTDSVTWTFRSDVPTLDQSNNAIYVCYKAGSTFTITGSGFESTDTFKDYYSGYQCALVS